MRARMWFGTLTALCGATFTQSAEAYDWVIAARVTNIEITYVPERINFKLDHNAGACPIGTWITWLPGKASVAENIASVASVQAGLMTARATGTNITVFGVNSTCVAQFIWLSDQ